MRLSLSLNKYGLKRVKRMDIGIYSAREAAIERMLPFAAINDYQIILSLRWKHQVVRDDCKPFFMVL